MKVPGHACNPYERMGNTKWVERTLRPSQGGLLVTDERLRLPGCNFDKTSASLRVIQTQQCELGQHTDIVKEEAMPETPAATLLFQAPTFQEPTFFCPRKYLAE